MKAVTHQHKLYNDEEDSLPSFGYALDGKGVRLLVETTSYRAAALRDITANC
jgi:hypothetical protein